jgi:hypothetical protein
MRIGVNVPNFGPGTDRHPLRIEELERPVPTLTRRIVLRLTDTPVTDPEWRVGEGTIGQILEDLEARRALGAETVVLDPFDGDPAETLRPTTAWRALATVADHSR